MAPHTRPAGEQGARFPRSTCGGDPPPASNGVACGPGMSRIRGGQRNRVRAMAPVSVLSSTAALPTRSDSARCRARVSARLPARNQLGKAGRQIGLAHAAQHSPADLPGIVPDGRLSAAVRSGAGCGTRPGHALAAAGTDAELVRNLKADAVCRTAGYLPVLQPPHSRSMERLTGCSRRRNMYRTR